MSTSTREEQDAPVDRISRSASALKAERLRESASVIRQSRRVAGSLKTPPPPKPAGPERGRGDDRRPELRRGEPENMQRRMDRMRAERALAQVRDPRWWDRATAGDLERARVAANGPGAPSSSRAEIRNEMRDVAQRRYGTSVSGAIRYERDNPQQPPPDMRTANGRALT